MNQFTPEAAERWNRIPAWAQQKILDNVFCTKCVGTIPMALKTAEMRGKDLILRGKCKYCGHDVCRVVEAETE